MAPNHSREHSLYTPKLSWPIHAHHQKARQKQKHQTDCTGHFPKQNNHSELADDSEHNILNQAISFERYERSLLSSLFFIFKAILNRAGCRNHYFLFIEQSGHYQDYSTLSSGILATAYASDKSTISRIGISGTTGSPKCWRLLTTSPEIGAWSVRRGGGLPGCLLSTTATGSPALIKDPGDFDSIYVVMPMKG